MTKGSGNPDNTGCLCKKGLALDMLGRPEEARQLKDKAQLSDSTYGGGTINKGPAVSELPSAIYDLFLFSIIIVCRYIKHQ
jgi:hypothetical protein